MQMTVAAGPMRPATRRACPPAPRVQSPAISPGCGSRMSISSPARTGTCVRVMSRRMAKALRDSRDLVGQVGLVGGTTRAVPDLQVIAVAHDEDVFGDPSVVEQRRAEVDAPAQVELGVEGPAAEEAAEP